MPETGQPFDAAPFATPLADGVGLVWEDPREVHRVHASFAGPVPQGLQLQYWRTKWPHLRLPKDHLEGRGSSGWWQLGDWFNGEWQTADAELACTADSATFTFRPLCASEFPDLDFPATYRTTMKLRLLGTTQAPTRLVAETDSRWEQRLVTVVWADAVPEGVGFTVFNGQVLASERLDERRYRLTLRAAANPAPYSFDRTLLTVAGEQAVTVALDDLAPGPVWAPDFGLAVLSGADQRDYAAVRAELAITARSSVYGAVAALPAQTWSRAWANMVPKRGQPSLPLAPDGSRHKFGLQPDGSLRYRTNNEVLLKCRGRDSERLAADAADLHLGFGLEGSGERAIFEGILPLADTVWETPVGSVRQEAFATVLAGTDAAGGAPEADACGVCLVRFTLAPGPGERTLRLRLTCRAGEHEEALTADEAEAVRAGDRLRLLADLEVMGRFVASPEGLCYELTAPPGQSRRVTFKVPYVWLTEPETERLRGLDFDREREAVAGYWRRRLQGGARLQTGVQELDDFHTAVAAHTLINAELEPRREAGADRPGEGAPEGSPGADGRRRFARAGSFSYLVFANESCMMIADLDRRGLHEQARECLEAFVHYQGTVPLPGDFRSQEGVLWGAAGYEHIGYNQHHGWILWCLVEHYRLTRDEAWLQSVAGSLLAAADWIIRERDRGLPSEHPEAGLLPAGNLEDITDWWPWLSTNAYSWRGLAAAAEALEHLGHEAAARVRDAADDYRAAILSCFTRAAQRAPLVRLRNGTSVPHFPSHVYRRGRSFGWICETLEGPLHLLITGLLHPHSPEAGWILNDYEDNLYLSEQYGYWFEDLELHWLDWGGFSMQACLLLDVEPYLYRDDVRHAVRAAFNGLAANFYPKLRMAVEHALPELGDWRGDHYKSPDEANACNWLRMLFVREEGEELLVGQAVPEDWLLSGQECGVERLVTYYGEVSVTYQLRGGELVVRLQGPRRNPPARIRVRLRAPAGLSLDEITVNGEPWPRQEGDWVVLPGDLGEAVLTGQVS